MAARNKANGWKREQSKRRTLNWCFYSEDDESGRHDKDQCSRQNQE